jgi:hypothetical protein
MGTRASASIRILRRPRAAAAANPEPTSPHPVPLESFLRQEKIRRQLDTIGLWRYGFSASFHSLDSFSMLLGPEGVRDVIISELFRDDRNAEIDPRLLNLVGDLWNRWVEDAYRQSAYDSATGRFSEAFLREWRGDGYLIPEEYFPFFDFDRQGIHLTDWSALASHFDYKTYLEQGSVISYGSDGMDRATQFLSCHRNGWQPSKALRSLRTAEDKEKAKRDIALDARMLADGEMRRLHDWVTENDFTVVLDAEQKLRVQFPARRFLRWYPSAAQLEMLQGYLKQENDNLANMLPYNLSMSFRKLFPEWGHRNDHEASIYLLLRRLRPGALAVDRNWHVIPLLPTEMDPVFPGSAEDFS